MDEGLIPLLARTRSRLNAVIIAHRALAWAAPAAIAAGLATAALRMAGVAAAGFLWWALLVATAAAAGAAAARRSRIDAAATARWLDERLMDGELLSAALVCLGRGSSEPFDAEIVRRAGERLEGASAIRPAPGPLAKRAAMAAAACAIGAYLVFLAAPASIGRSPAGAAARAAPGAEGAESAAASALADGGSAAAAAFASSLFPEDKRLATLAERALREGRIDDLEAMLKTADLEYESKLSRAIGEPERKKLASERQRIQEAASAIAMRYREGSGGSGESRGEGGDGDGTGQRGDPFLGDPRSGERGLSGGGGTGSERRSGAGSYGGQSPRPGQRDGESGPGSSADAAEGEAGTGGSGSSGGGLAGGGPGFGSGSGAEGDWAPVSPSSGVKKMVIEASKDAPFFELVLPGQGAASPIAGLVPDSRRSAESAMAREAIPLEYEDFVRSYFLELSKGESR